MYIQNHLKNQAEPSFLQQEALSLAPQLLGMALEISEYYIVITEVEAYDAHKEDKACHGYPKVTKRSQSLALAAGHVYVYIIYGMHYCMNIVADKEGHAAGCLIRGGIIFNKSSGQKLKEIIGPARLTKFLNITKAQDGLALGDEIKLWHTDISPKYEVTPRIGISQSKDLLWRFAAKNR
ncbi:MAG: DNA-3-methyladenine glycosylase [Alphaproteobacteria bacterium]